MVKKLPVFPSSLLVQFRFIPAWGIFSIRRKAQTIHRWSGEERETVVRKWDAGNTTFVFIWFCVKSASYKYSHLATLTAISDASRQAVLHFRLMIQTLALIILTITCKRNPIIIVYCLRKQHKWLRLGLNPSTFQSKVWSMSLDCAAPPHSERGGGFKTATGHWLGFTLKSLPLFLLFLQPKMPQCFDCQPERTKN